MTGASAEGQVPMSEFYFPGDIASSDLHRNCGIRFVRQDRRDVIGGCQSDWPVYRIDEGVVLGVGIRVSQQDVQDQQFGEVFMEALVRSGFLQELCDLVCLGSTIGCVLIVGMNVHRLA